CISLLWRRGAEPSRSGCEGRLPLHERSPLCAGYDPPETRRKHIPVGSLMTSLSSNGLRQVIPSSKVLPFAVADGFSNSQQHRIHCRPIAIRFSLAEHEEFKVRRSAPATNPRP